MEWLWYGLILSYVLGMVIWGGLSLRTPRCHDCHLPTVTLADQIGDTSPPIFQLAYRCPRCRAVLGRRLVHPFDD